MKKTIKINISGTIFHVDEDAFEILEAYLNKLKQHFTSKTEGDEIITDIEYRIAELMQLKTNEQKQVINIDDIEEIIAIMGKPEDLFEADEETPNDSANEPKGFQSRKFYRDIDNNVAGGVCSGLGQHFNVDPIILRILFIVLAIPLAAFPVLLYFILWIVIPAAITTQQKMDMKGGNYTVSDIENSVRSEYEKVKDNFNKFKDSDKYQRTRNNLNNAGNGFVEILNFFGKLILTIIGIVMIFTGISLIASMFGAFVFSDSVMFWTHTDQHHFLIPDFLFSIVNPQSIILVVICFIILIAAPIIAIIYWGLKLTIRFKANDKVISIVASVAWILSAIILLGIGLFEAKEYAFSTSLDESIEVELPQNTTLYINSSTDIDEYSEIYFFEEGMNVYSHEENPDRIYLEPELRIKYTWDDEISIKLEKEARGATNSRARKNASNIEYNWHLRDSILIIDPLFYHDNEEKWAFPELDIVLYLPRGQKVCIDKDLKQTFDYADRADNIWNSNIPGKCWVMTEDGLDYP